MIRAILYTPGRVGTMSTLWALKRSGINVLLGHDFKQDTLDRFKRGYAVPIITCTRDPMARNISMFFYNLRNIAPTEELQNRFTEDYDHTAILGWYDVYFRDQIGVDIYTTTDVTVLRLEDENEHKEQQLNDLLKPKNRITIKRDHENKTKQRKAHADFLASYRAPSALLNTIYGSRYVRRFYQADEIQGFRDRWTQ